MDHYFPGEMASDVLLFVQRDKWDISSSMILKKIENLFDRIGRIQQQDQRTWDAVPKEIGRRHAGGRRRTVFLVSNAACDDDER
ncbi:hypothetical protein OUZ56_022944 [Daphnia magna]|uniref:Uncharacterized protein n=1 Tax=Daphnia magna TaxID=35525 RepID=A0ABR0AYK1_9CRUS|nr:hypothetical protein OUZ56_022944 [Daphnia magna]